MQCTIHFEKLPKYTYSIAWNKISMYLTCISVFHENVYSKCTTESYVFVTFPQCLIFSVK